MRRALRTWSRMASSARTVGLPRGLFGPDAVDVGYEPWRALGESALRVGPDGRAAIVTHRGVLVRLAAGQHLGRQTTRNPSCLDRPPLRAAVNGFAWGYGMAPAIRKSGWLAVADLELDVTLVQLACGRRARTLTVAAPGHAAVTATAARCPGSVPPLDRRRWRRARSICVTRRAAPRSDIWCAAIGCVCWFAPPMEHGSESRSARRAGRPAARAAGSLPAPSAGSPCSRQCPIDQAMLAAFIGRGNAPRS